MDIEEKQAGDIFDELLDRVESGEEIVITRHGRAVAKLVSLPGPLLGLENVDSLRE